MYRNYFKYVFDVVVGLITAIIFAPLFGTIALALFVQNRGPIFFYQDRIGYEEQDFKIIKFKTMTDRRDKQDNLLPDVERITALGNLVRRLSLDELPQLINVLKGDMSLIGPRPLLPKYLPLFSKEQQRRHEVKPGITGWAQVNGRNSISWTQKFEHDLYYVEHLSFGLDLRILWMTCIKVLSREGINQSEMRPMQPFDGTN